MRLETIPVVYEDDWLLVVDKPAGLLTIPTPRKESNTLTNILNTCAQEQGETFRLHPCHRLDRETSGLIIYAKGKSLQQKMMQAFKERQVHKTYIAFVQGALHEQQGEIKKPIEGESALTRYKAIEQRKGFTIVEARPVTGKTNQVRLHFKYLGHPILGDTKFAFRRDFSIKAKRLCLHAAALEFLHPVTHKQIRLHAALPRALKELLERH